jgi:hypothetical protein
MNKKHSILYLLIFLFLLSTYIVNAENVEKDRKNTKIGLTAKVNVS